MRNFHALGIASDTGTILKCEFAVDDDEVHRHEPPKMIGRLDNECRTD